MRLEGLDELEQALQKKLSKMPHEINRFAAREGEVLRAMVINETPKDTGVLQGGWHRTRPRQGSVDVYNNTDYAAHVEYGHRTRGGKGKPVLGRKMLHKGMLSYKKSFAKRVGEQLRNMLEDE